MAPDKLVIEIILIIMTFLLTWSPFWWVEVKRFQVLLNKEADETICIYLYIFVR